MSAASLHYKLRSAHGALPQRPMRHACGISSHASSSDSSQLNRRTLVLSGIIAVTLQSRNDAQAKDDENDGTSGTASKPAAQPSAIGFSFVSPEVKSKLNQRDEMMQWKCTGGMFDCEGDRAEQARQEIEELKKSFARK